ncbi:Vacuolar protein sorting-associated protein 2 homolog 2-like protein, partial [Drosera capensis]
MNIFKKKTSPKVIWVVDSWVRSAMGKRYDGSGRGYSRESRLRFEIAMEGQYKALRTSKREMAVATRGIEREITSLQLEEKKLVAEIKKEAKSGNEA